MILLAMFRIVRLCILLDKSGSWVVCDDVDGLGEAAIDFCGFEVTIGFASFMAAIDVSCSSHFDGIAAGSTDCEPFTETIPENVVNHANIFFNLRPRI